VSNGRGAVVVCCDEGDVSAGWLARGLAERARDVTLVTTRSLLRSVRWTHTLDANGARTVVVLTDGRTLGDEETTTIVNRVARVPTEHLPIAAADRDYADQELHAIWLSWLSSGPRVLNRAKPTGLCGEGLSQAGWLVEAGRHGLPTARIVRAPGLEPDPDELRWEASLLVACGAAFGPPAVRHLAEGAVRLAQAVDADLLEVHLGRREEGPTVLGATALPDLRRGGDALLDHLAEVLP
jgi:hypothetical protein